MQRSRVDLPLPDAPMMVTTSPGMTAKSMSLSTKWLPKDLRRFSTRMSGSAAMLLAMVYLAFFLSREYSELPVPATVPTVLVMSDTLVSGWGSTERRLANLPNSQLATIVRHR